MYDFDKVHFEELMGEASQLHNEGRYEDALTVSLQAYDVAPMNSSEKGRAARDNGARCDRLGRTHDAEAWAMEAFDTHNKIIATQDIPTRESYRERSVSAMYVGVNGLRKAIQGERSTRELRSPDLLRFLHLTWSDLKFAKALAPEGINQKVDQYEVNAARRVSIGEALFGDRKRGLSIGTRAVGLAFMSESRKLDTSSPNLSTKQRLQSKIKALLGGVAAVGISILASPKDNVRRKFALRAAERTL